MTKPITVEVSEYPVRKFGGDEARFGREMYETAVVQWYAKGRISPGKGAELVKRVSAFVKSLVSAVKDL